MGGSVAKAIRSNIIGRDDQDGKIFALDKNEESLSAALTSGIIDLSFTPDKTKEMLAQADMVLSASTRPQP